MGKIRKSKVRKDIAKLVEARAEAQGKADPQPQSPSPRPPRQHWPRDSGLGKKVEANPR